jgi:hypothetical protein
MEIMVVHPYISSFITRHPYMIHKDQVFVADVMIIEST